MSAGRTTTQARRQANDRAQWSLDPFLRDVTLTDNQRTAALAALARHDATDLAAMCGLTGDMTT